MPKENAAARCQPCCEGSEALCTHELLPGSRRGETCSGPSAAAEQSPGADRGGVLLAVAAGELAAAMPSALCQRCQSTPDPFPRNAETQTAMAAARDGESRAGLGVRGGTRGVRGDARSWSVEGTQARSVALADTGRQTAFAGGG